MLSDGEKRLVGICFPEQVHIFETVDKCTCVCVCKYGYIIEWHIFQETVIGIVFLYFQRLIGAILLCVIISAHQEIKKHTSGLQIYLVLYQMNCLERG